MPFNTSNSVRDPVQIIERGVARAEMVSGLPKGLNLFRANAV